MTNFFKRRRLTPLYAARKAATERLQRAVERGDTREQHAAQKALREATHACMRAEVRR